MKFTKEEIIDVGSGEINEPYLLLFMGEVVEALTEGHLIKISLNLSKYNLKKVSSYHVWLQEVKEEYQKQIEEDIKNSTYDLQRSVKLSFTLSAEVVVEELEEIREHRGVKFIETHKLIMSTLEEKLIEGSWLEGVYLSRDGSLVLVANF